MKFHCKSPAINNNSSVISDKVPQQNKAVSKPLSVDREALHLDLILQDSVLKSVYKALCPI